MQHCDRALKHSFVSSYWETLEEVGVAFQQCCQQANRVCLCRRVSRYLLVCPHHSSDPLLTLKFSFQQPVHPTRLLFPPSAGTEGAQGATLAEEGEGRQRWDRGGGEEEKVEEREHISILLTAFLFSLTHTLSPRHILCWEAGRKGRELGGRRGKRIML